MDYLQKIRQNLRTAGFFLKRYGRMIMISIVLFTAVFGGGYYLCNRDALHTVQYEINTTYYVEYEGDGEPSSNFNNIYINGATWDTWVDTEWFLSRVEKKLEGVEMPAREQLKQYISASLPADQRMPVSRVRTDNRELTESLNEALQETFVEFGRYHQKITEITVEDTSEIISIRAENNLPVFLAAGAVTGLVISLLCGICCWQWYLPVYMPRTITDYFGIPAFSLEQDSGQAWMQLCRGKKTAVTSAEAQPEIQAFIKKFPQIPLYEIPCLTDHPENAAKLRSAEAILLVIKPGTCQKSLEKLLSYMQLQSCPPQAILICDKTVE